MIINFAELKSIGCILIIRKITGTFSVYIIDSHESSPQSMDDIMRYTNQSVPQPNSEEEAVSIDGNKIFKNNNDVSEADKIKIDGDVSDDDAFLTPNGSEYDDNDDGKIDDFKSAMPDSDNEEMDDVEEGPDMFLVG